MNERQQAIVAGVVSVLVTLLFFVFLLKPKMSEVADARERFEQSQKEEGGLRNELARLDDVRARAPETTARLARVQQYLPSSPQLPGFIRLLQDAATGAGVDLRSIAPSPPGTLEGGDGIQTIAVTLTLSGGFFRIHGFLARLEQLDRIVEVTSISLAPATDDVTGAASLLSTFSLRMYVVQPDAQLGVTVGRRSGASPSPSPTGGAR